MAKILEFLGALGTEIALYSRESVLLPAQPKVKVARWFGQRPGLIDNYNEMTDKTGNVLVNSYQSVYFFKRFVIQRGHGRRFFQ